MLHDQNDICRLFKESFDIVHCDKGGWRKGYHDNRLIVAYEFLSIKFLTPMLMMWPAGVEALFSGLEMHCVSSAW